MHVCIYVCMYVCMYLCIYVCMYLCMNVCMYVVAMHAVMQSTIRIGSSHFYRLRYNGLFLLGGGSRHLWFGIASWPNASLLLLLDLRLYAFILEKEATVKPVELFPVPTCMCVLIYVCMIYACMYVCMYVCMYICRYVCRYVGMYVGMYIHTCILHIYYIHIYIV